MISKLRFATHIALSMVPLLFLSGCGQQTSQDAATPPSASVLDEAPAPAFRSEAAGDVPPATVEPERDFFSREPIRRRKSPVTEALPQRLLTAGSINDLASDDEFRNYFNKARRSAASFLPDKLTTWDGRRIEIMVRNAEGKPVQDALVRIFKTVSTEDIIPLKYQPDVPATDSNVLVASLRTSSDGRTHFLPGIDGTSRDDIWDVEVSGPDGELRVRQEGLQTPAAWWDFAIGHEPSRLPQHLDLALVIDTTGSMGDELEYLKLEISSIAACVKRLFPGVNQRFALILYRDNGDRYVTRSFDFTDSLADFQQTLNDQHAAGGGDYPEAMHAALEQASELSWNARNTARMMFLVGDAPPHSRHMQRTFEAVQKLRQREVAIFPIAGSGTRDEAEFTFRTAAFMTMGQYLFLTDHSGIGLPHATPHVAEYNVEWLSAVMLRMIASELSGRDVLPSEILATEETNGHLLAQSVQRYPDSYRHHSEFPLPSPLLNAARWAEIRPLVALALLLLLALAERYFARRPARHTTTLRGPSRSE